MDLTVEVGNSCVEGGIIVHAEGENQTVLGMLAWGQLQWLIHTHYLNMREKDDGKENERDFYVPVYRQYTTVLLLCKLNSSIASSSAFSFSILNSCTMLCSIMGFKRHWMLDKQRDIIKLQP